jgi:MFS family permease
VKTSLVLFCSLICIGQIVFTIGVMIKSWGIIYLGEIIIGVGGESYSVANSVLLSEWFIGKELAFAFGANLSLSKLGSVFTDLLSPRLSDSVNFEFALWFGSILNATAMFCIFCLFPIEYSIEKKIKRNQIYQLLHLPAGDTIITTVKTVLGEEEIDRHSNSSTNRNSRNLNSPREQDALLASVGPEKDSTKKSSTSSSNNNINLHVLPDDNEENNDSEDRSADQIPNLRDIFKLNHIFWVLAVTCGVVYACVLPFNYVSSALLLERDYFQPQTNDDCSLTFPTQCQNNAWNPPIHCASSKWFEPPIPVNYTSAYPSLTTSDIDCTDDFWDSSSNCATYYYCQRLIDGENVASVMMSIPFMISACLSPIAGIFIDRFGYRAVLAWISSAVLIVIHVFLGYTKVDPVGPLVGQGLAFTSFAAALWPSIPLVVDNHLQGIAFGVCFSLLNFATLVVPLMVAWVYQMSDNSYLPNVELLFTLLSGMGLILGVYMHYYDYYYGGNVLNGSSASSEKEGEERERL